MSYLYYYAPASVGLYSSWYSIGDPEPCDRSLAGAWAVLAAGHAAVAADAFGCLADLLPRDGLPLIGLGLASAALGNHEAAIAASRAALRIDPEALYFVPDDGDLHLRLRELLLHYDDVARHTYGDLDSVFMVALLRYLLNETNAAHYATEVGITLGDTDQSMLNLRALLSDE